MSRHTKIHGLKETGRVLRKLAERVGIARAEDVPVEPPQRNGGKKKKRVAKRGKKKAG